jgi:acetoin:2,6-dichlorophenolindophenol oxidoreductase subunit alpha
VWSVTEETAPLFDAVRYPSPDADTLLGLFRQMCEIRYFERTAEDWFTKSLIRGSTHLYVGEEAVAVGIVSALRSGDTTTCTYRGHGVLLAQGADMDRSFAELLGRHGGLCGGKGGSMHLTDVQVGALGSFAIVGAHVPVTVGAAWAAQLTNSGAVSVSFFGDGATNIGAVHEALNLAGVWKLPAVFVVENNLYGEYTPIAATSANPNLSDRASMYGMRGVAVDGNDVVAVRAEAIEAVSRARDGGGPTLLEARTYRQCGHSRSDPATYRPAGELEQWLLRDPLSIARQRLRDAGISSEQLDEVDASAADAVGLAAERALTWPAPPPESLFDDVWSRT